MYDRDRMRKQWGSLKHKKIFGHNNWKSEMVRLRNPLHGHRKKVAESLWFSCPIYSHLALPRCLGDKRPGSMVRLVHNKFTFKTIKIMGHKPVVF